MRWGRCFMTGRGANIWPSDDWIFRRKVTPLFSFQRDPHNANPKADLLDHFFWEDVLDAETNGYLEDDNESV